MKNIMILLWVLSSFCNTTNAQLVYITVCDNNSYYDSITCLNVYPKYKLKKSQDNTLYLNDNVIFNSKLLPDHYNRIHYEILNDSILVVTFLNDDQKGISLPMFFKRDNVNFILLNDPYFIYKIDFKGRHVVGDKETFMKLSLHRSDSDIWKFHYIIEFLPPNIVLKATTGEIDTIIMEKVVNPLMRY